MIKTILGIIIVFAGAFTVLYVFEPVYAQQILNMVPYLPSYLKFNVTTTTTIPIPTTGVVELNISQSDNPPLSYVAKSSTVIHITGGYDRISIIARNGSTIYMDIQGSYDTLEFTNAKVVLNITSDSTSITLYNSTIISKNIVGKGTQIANESA